MITADKHILEAQRIFDNIFFLKTNSQGNLSFLFDDKPQLPFETELKKAFDNIELAQQIFILLDRFDQRRSGHILNLIRKLERHIKEQGLDDPAKFGSSILANRGHHRHRRKRF
jgi:hypothetical protein